MSDRTKRLVMRYTSDRRRLGEITPKTADDLSWILWQFADSCPEDPAKIAKPTIRRYLKFLEKANIAPSTKRTRIAGVRIFLDWLVREEIIKVNPIRSMGVRVRVEPRLVPRGLNVDEVEALLAVIPDSRGRCVAMLALQLGLRIGEIADLDVHDIDWRARTLRVTGKGGHQRLLPITEQAYSAINDYLAEHPASGGPLIRSYRHPASGLGWHYLSHLLSRWMRDAGIKRRAYDGRSAHALRHTMAADMLEATEDLMAVSTALGHAHLKTTQLYVRSTAPAKLRDKMEGRRYG